MLLQMRICYVITFSMLLQMDPFEHRDPEYVHVQMHYIIKVLYGDFFKIKI